MARILVCDDEPGIRSLLGMLLGLDHDVTEAGDGQEALEALRSGDPYDVLILDVMMPRLDGFATLRQVREDPDLADLKVIMLTARAATDDRDAGIRAGADAYIGKPFEPEDLQEVLDGILAD